MHYMRRGTNLNSSSTVRRDSGLRTRVAGFSTLLDSNTAPVNFFHIHGLDPAKEAPSLEEYLALVHPEDRDFMASLVKRIVEEPSGFDVTKRIIRPNGEVGYVRGVGTPVVENGTLKRFIGTGVDVTEHELLTQELRRREAYLAELFEKAPEAIALMD